MGTLEDLRDICLECSDAREDFSPADDDLAVWVAAGCPGYDPVPWGAPGEVPQSDGVYALHYDEAIQPFVMVVTIRDGVMRMEGYAETTRASVGGAGPLRFRYLCPLPTVPKEGE